MIEGAFSKPILGAFSIHIVIINMKKKIKYFQLIVSWCHWKEPY